MIPLNLDTQGYSLTPSMLSPALPLGASYHTWSEGVLRFGGGTNFKDKSQANLYRKILGS